MNINKAISFSFLRILNIFGHANIMTADRELG